MDNVNKRSIALGFYLAILFMALISVSITAISIYSKNLLLDSSTRIVDVEVKKEILSKDIASYMFLMSRAEKSLILSRTNALKEKFIAQINDFDIQIDDSLAALKTVANEVELEKIALFDEKLLEYRDIRKRVIDAIEKKKQKRQFAFLMAVEVKSLMRRN